MCVASIANVMFFQQLAVGYLRVWNMLAALLYVQIFVGKFPQCNMTLIWPVGAHIQ